MRETGKKAGHPHLTVPTLASRFLIEQELVLKKARYALVEHYITAFSASHPTTLCSEITKTVVLKWVRDKSTWGDWARHDAIACVKKLFKWGFDETQISRNPVANLPNPTPESRQRVMTDIEHSLGIPRPQDSGQNRKPLVVYLPPCLVTLTRMLLRMHPTEPLFCQESGAEWTKDHVASRVRKPRKELRLSDDVVLYAYSP